MKPTFNDKFIAYLALASGIAISCVAEFYSIMGMIAIYPAAVIPIIIMGVVLGIGKLSATVWVKQNWEWSPNFLKVYILPAVALLMLITSVGVFGFLSKAHSDQSLVSGDVQAKIAVYDEKIKIEKENIDVNRKALKQMDEAVDQTMGRSSTETGADRAVAIRRGQQKERTRLLADISTSQQRITALNEERAPIAAEVRKVEAEVGPIKYIAAFVYGDNPDANILEKAVSWVSILIVIVLDPLAIVLLLASQYSFQRFNQIKEEEHPDYMQMFEDRIKSNMENPIAPPDPQPFNAGPFISGTFQQAKYEQDDGPLTEDQVEQIREDVKDKLPTGEVIYRETLLKDPAERFIKAWKENELTPTIQELDTDVGEKPTDKELEDSLTAQEEPSGIVAPQPIVSTEESRKVRNKVFLPPEGFVHPTTYVQNEEQQESNIWSTTTTESSPLPDDEEHVIYLAANIRAGRIHINDIPFELIDRVKARL